jgi:hypothetical protein
MMSWSTKELEKDVYMSDDHATFRFSDPTENLGTGWKKIGTIKSLKKKLMG